MSLLKNALEKSKDTDTVHADTASIKTPITQKRTEKLDEKQVRVTRKEVDPAICKVWEMHDRDYQLLKYEDCKDLIENLLADGKQQFPAIVRSLGAVGKGEPRYEIIAGARRHWSITWIRENKPEHKDFPYLIEPRDLSDQEAFQLMDAENREDVSKDISDYERAASFALHIKNETFPSWRRLGEEIGLSTGNLDRYKKMSDLPKIIVDLFPDKREIKLSYAENIMKLLGDDEAKKKLDKKIPSLKTTHYSALEVYKAIMEIAKEKPKTTMYSWDASKSGKSAMTAKVKASGDIQLTIKATSGATKAELVRYFKEALEMS